MTIWRPRGQEYRFDDERTLKPGDSVIVTRVYAQFAWPALSQALERPESLSAVFRGCHPVRNAHLRAQLGGVVRDVVGWADGQRIPVPHLGIQIPGTLLNGESSLGVPLRSGEEGLELDIIGPQCDWTLPDIWEQVAAEVAQKHAPYIPAALPGDFAG